MEVKNKHSMAVINLCEVICYQSGVEGLNCGLGKGSWQWGELDILYPDSFLVVLTPISGLGVDSHFLGVDFSPDVWYVKLKRKTAHEESWNEKNTNCVKKE